MEKELILSLEEARKLYKTSSPELKVIFENTFGKNKLIESVFDRVYDVESACREIGIDYNSFLSSVRYLSADTIAYEYLKVITKALNGKWKANWADGNQKKWFPWFRLSSSGFAVDDAYYYCSGPGAGSASRLCFETSELATYAGKQFIDLYRDFIL